MADSFDKKEIQEIKLDIVTSAIERGVKFFDCIGAINRVAENVIFQISYL